MMPVTPNFQHVFLALAAQRPINPLLALLLLLVAGCNQTGGNRVNQPAVSEKIRAVLPDDVRDAFEDPDNFEVLSVFPFSKVSQEVARLSEKDKALFSQNGEIHGFFIYGRVKVAKDEAREVVKKIYSGIEQATPQANCFEPRHAIIAKKGDVTVEMVICFECNNILVYQVSNNHYFSIGDIPKEGLDQILHKARVKIEGDDRK